MNDRLSSLRYIDIEDMSLSRNCRPTANLVTAKRHVCSVQMQICVDSFYVVSRTLTIDPLNTKSMCFDIVSRTTTVPSFDQGFSFYHGNIGYTQTHISPHTSKQSHHNIGAAVLRIVGAG